MPDLHFCMAGPLFFLIWWLAIFITSVVAAGANSIPEHGEDCEIAQTKCSYRANCYHALHSYMVDCADVLAGRTTRCTYACKRALISLTSSEAGQTLSNCYCGNNEFCLRSKERIEVCRPEVSHATADNTVVSCSVAKWICAADPLCSTALDYYHRLCRSMFHGRKCTPRCNNSLAILDRQEKAGKLRDCYCDGSEEFPCVSIKQNTQLLCYGQEWVNNELHIPVTTEETLPSCSNRLSSSILGYCFLVFMVFMLNHRTSGEELNTSSSIENSVSLSQATSCSIKNLKQTYDCDKQWPWWWTSEQRVT
uniref:Growth arrest-specific protein 1 n=1 Tax=Parasteatoda tepidariorum TaxID=114398 RepID=A0A2L2YIA9_PARTP